MDHILVFVAITLSVRRVYPCSVPCRYVHFVFLFNHKWPERKLHKEVHNHKGLVNIKCEARVIILLTFGMLVHWSNYFSPHQLIKIYIYRFRGSVDRARGVTEYLLAISSNICFSASAKGRPCFVLSTARRYSGSPGKRTSLKPSAGVTP